jgi:predicted CopG family antitoxin
LAVPQIVISEQIYDRLEEEKVEAEGFNSVSEAARHVLWKNLEESENGGE